MTDLGSALTLGQMVDRAAARFPDRTAVVFKQERISYADLKRRADDFARGLLALGLGPGDHVVLWMPNRVEWNVANLGIAKIGAVTVTCNSRYKALEVEYVLRQSDAKALTQLGDTAVWRPGGAAGLALALSEWDAERLVERLDRPLHSEEPSLGDPGDVPALFRQLLPRRPEDARDLE